MNSEKKSQIQKIVIENMTFFDTQLNEIKIRMFTEELMCLSPEQVRKAFAEFRTEKGRRLMPMPADLKEKFRPSLSPRTIADEVANKIFLAVRTHGYIWSDGYVENEKKYFVAKVNGKNLRYDSFGEALFAEVGEMGVAIVERLGGYLATCQTLEGEEGVIRAQLRDIALSVLEQERAGVRDKITSKTILELSGRKQLNTSEAPTDFKQLVEKLKGKENENI